MLTQWAHLCTGHLSVETVLPDKSSQSGMSFRIPSALNRED